MSHAIVDPSLLDQLRAVDTPTICNALEDAAGERSAQGFTLEQFHCTDPDAMPIVGYARTATIRAAQPSSAPPAERARTALEYYRYVCSAPGPTIVIIQDLDPHPGTGAHWGEVNTTVHRALGVLGCITNGSVRDLPLLARPFPLLAGRVTPSHAFVHVVDFGREVNVFGLAVAHGDLIHADRHGAVRIPLALAARLPWAIDLGVRREKVILDRAKAPGYDLAALEQAFQAAREVT